LESNRGLVAVNKWLVAVTVIVIALSAGVYFWSENAAKADDGVEVAPAVNIAGTDLTQHVREASTSSETLYGVLQPTWDALSEDEQKQFLSKAFDFAKARGMKKVNLLNSRGRTVGYAAPDRLEVYGPQ
jgi:sugar phosphate isomerase/epimerase